MLFRSDAKKSARSSAENCRSRPFQARSWSVRENHSHRSRRARLARSRSWTPRPPFDMGRQTRRQLTWQWPPLAAARPAHKKQHSIFQFDEASSLAARRRVVDARGWHSARTSPVQVAQVCSSGWPSKRGAGRQSKVHISVQMFCWKTDYRI